MHCQVQARALQPAPLGSVLVGGGCGDPSTLSTIFLGPKEVNSLPKSIVVFSPWWRT